MSKYLPQLFDHRMWWQKQCLK